MTRIAITGASGFIGQHLLGQLRRGGHHIKLLSRSPSIRDADDHIEHIPGRLEDRDSLERWVDGAHAVIHLAGATSAPRRTDYFRINAAGTTQLVAALKAKAPRARLIHVSSLAARMPTLSHYCASKWAGESIVRTSQLPWTLLRPPAVYGGNDRVMAPLWGLLKRGWVPRFGPPEARFSLLHVDDLTRALALLIEPNAFASARGQCIELDDGHQRHGQRGYGWLDLAEASQTAQGRRARFIPVPSWVLATSARISAMAARAQGRSAVLNPDKLGELRHNNWVCADHDPAWLPGWSPQRRLSDTLVAQA